ncbi:MAG: hypothetical protein HOP02_07375 [Methylococcaceae bacterium]|nr:hypothetical protein [Methylococcaceae bacterium]
MKRLNITSPRDIWLIQLVLGLMPMLLLFMLVINTTHNHFTYTLDDPYIHLALARNIAHGHYGININEASAPSSSILWPFLLAPFATFNLFEYTPLIINSLCLWALIYCLNKLFLEKAFFLRLLLIGTVLLSINAYGLVFTGMEHNLQILLVGIIVQTVASLKNDADKDIKPVVPTAVFIAIVLLPLIRYEGLAIALPVLAYLFCRGDRKRAIIALLVLMVSVVGFSGYLYSLNLGLLPSSVLLKSSHGNLDSIVDNVIKNLDKYGFLLLPVALLSTYYWRKDFALALVIFSATLLHFILGKFGWFGRYEAYWLLFIFIFCYQNLKNKIDESAMSLITLLIIPFAFASMVFCTLKTPLAASNIYNQQVQTAKIAQMLAEPIAVQDLGVVALRSNQYVLDLVGLGSLEVLKLRQASSGFAWMETLMKRKAVKYAFIYDSDIREKPATWIKVAEMQIINQDVLTPAYDTVAFYAVDSQSTTKLRDVMSKFSSIEKSINFSVKIY